MMERYSDGIEQWWEVRVSPTALEELSVLSVDPLGLFGNGRYMCQHEIILLAHKEIEAYGFEQIPHKGTGNNPLRTEKYR